MLVVAAAVLLLEGAYLIFATTLLPRYLQDAARRVGLELTLASSRSWYPGSVRLRGARVVRPGAWSLRAAQLDLMLEEPWRLLAGLRVDRAYASGVYGDWSSNHMGPFEAHWQLGDGPAHSPHTEVYVAGPRAHLVLGRWSGQIELRASVQLQRRPEGEPGFNLNEGVVTALAANLGRAPAGLEPSGEAASTADGRLRASLRSRQGVFSTAQGFSLRARLTAAGGDAGIWLDLANASSTVRWMLAALVDQPFELEADVVAWSGAVAIEQLRLEAGMTRARGGLYYDEQEYRGAFLVQRGTGSIGIAISNAGVTARLMPEPDWFSRELEAAGESFPDKH